MTENRFIIFNIVFYQNLVKSVFKVVKVSN